MDESMILDVLDSGSQSVIGPQSDGTYGTPWAAQQYNSPANTAGYSSPMSDNTFKLLTQGISTIGNVFNTSQILDYKRYEATNGGLFMQGQMAGGLLTNRQQVNPNISMLLLLIMGAMFVMKA